MPPEWLGSIFAFLARLERRILSNGWVDSLRVFCVGFGSYGSILVSSFVEIRQFVVQWLAKQATSPPIGNAFLIL